MVASTDVNKSLRVECAPIGAGNYNMAVLLQVFELEKLNQWSDSVNHYHQA